MVDSTYKKKERYTPSTDKRISAVSIPTGQKPAKLLKTIHEEHLKKGIQYGMDHPVVRVKK